MNPPISNNELHLPGKKRKELVFPSRKTNKNVICHNTLEADYCLLLEHNPMVMDYCSQPAALIVEVSGRQHRYQPHFRVETEEMTYYTEIRPDFDALSMRAKLMRKAAVEMLQTNNSSLVLFDRDDIRPEGAELTNLRFLYTQSFHVSPGELAQFLRVLPSLKFPIELEKLRNQLDDIPDKTIFHAMFYQILDVDMSQRLSSDTRCSGYSFGN